MNPSDFLQEVLRENVKRPGTHVIEPGLTDDELEAWRKGHPGVNLPADIVAFLRVANGFRLYPTPDTPIGAVCLLSLREIEYAPRLMYAGNTTCDDRYANSFFALTDDPDSAQHLVLDMATSRYFVVDPIAGLEEEGIVGSNWLAGLTWIANTARLGYHD